MHDLVLNHYSTQVTIDTFAAVAISAGTLPGLACGGLTGAQCDALLSAAPRRIPIDFHVGNGDPFATQLLADSDRYLANGWTSGSSLWLTLFVGNHTYSSSHAAEIWTNLCPFQVVP